MGFHPFSLPTAGGGAVWSSLFSLVDDTDPTHGFFYRITRSHSDDFFSQGRAGTASPSGRRRIGQHMLALATYLGHVNINATYWYLETTAELLCDIASAGEKSLSGGRS